MDASSNNVSKITVKNNEKLVDKIKAVKDHKIEGLNLTIGDAALIAVVIFVVFMLRKMPIIAAAMAIVILIIYKHGRS
jgi:transcriptional regulatory protein LevR